MTSKQIRKMAREMHRPPTADKALPPVIVYENDSDQTEDLQSYEVWTDGSYRDGGRGSWSAVIASVGGKRIISGQISDCEGSSEAELLAVVQALSYIEDRSRVRIYTDYQSMTTLARKGNLRKLAKQGWVRRGRPVPHRKHWEELLPLLEKHEVRFEWVKAHSGLENNELCDDVAGILSSIPFNAESFISCGKDSERLRISLRDFVEKMGR
jgi:ribonuclease HI